MKIVAVTALLLSLASACSDGAGSTTTGPTSPSSTATSSSTAVTSTASAVPPPTTTSTTTEAPPASEPTSTTTTDPIEVEPRFVLLLDGFAELGVLGDEAEDVVSAFESEFGLPTEDSDWIPLRHGCLYEGPMRTLVWIEPGVRLVFVDGESPHGTGQHLVHYTTLLPVRPPWEMEGLRRGMTIEDVTERFPGALVLPGTALDYIQFVPEVGSFASIDAAGEIREFWGGTDYCAG